MIVSAIFGLFMNVLMVDNATGQNLTRAILLNHRLEKLQEEKIKKNYIHKGLHDDE